MHEVKTLVISSELSTWVIIGSIWIFRHVPVDDLSARPVRPPRPPKAVPRQLRPVTSWNGRVASSLPDSADGR